MSDEELQALLSGDVDLDSIDIEESPKAKSSTASETVKESSSEGDEHHEENVRSIVAEPPAANDDNKVIGTLDDVTKDSEAKASEIFDSIDRINESLGDIENKINSDVKSNLEYNIELFEKLSNKFPKIEAFKTALDNNKTCIESMENITDNIYVNQDEIMMIMDKMQYQDIHRQKIERVINVMRSLALYMNHLFSSSVDDSKRTSSANHIEGDKNTEELVNEDELETLIASFGNK